MSRLFSVNVLFQEKERFALVNIFECGLDLHCRVRYADQQLNRLVGSEGFVFNLQDGLKQSVDYSNEQTKKLLAKTSEAIRKYLKKHPLPVV